MVVKREGIVLCLVGPAGSGKTTLARRLLGEFGDSIRVGVSVTTRSPRAGEVDGRNYHFVSRAEFEQKISRDEFFEWEEVHGNLYGQLKSTFAELKEGKDLLLDIDIRGSQSVRAALPRNAVVVFLVPPSFKVLRERIIGRSSVSEEELEKRLQTAQKEYERVRQLFDSGTGLDYMVVNQDLDECSRLLVGIVESERSRISRIHKEEIVRLCSVA